MRAERIAPNPSPGTGPVTTLEAAVSATQNSTTPVLRNLKRKAKVKEEDAASEINKEDEEDEEDIKKLAVLKVSHR